MATTLTFNPITGNFDSVLLATANVQAWMATPSSANLLAALSDKTGTGLNVFGTAPTLTGPVTLTEAVGSSALTITGATQTASFPALSITQTWNNSGVAFAGIRANFTNTASANTSALIDLQLGGGSDFTVARADGILGAGAKELTFGRAAGGATGIRLQTLGGLLYATRGDQTALFGLNNTAFVVPTGSSIGWGATSSATPDAFFIRTAAASIQLGADVNGAAVSQTIQAANGITGTDRTGGNFTLASGKGTGAGAVSSLIFQTPTVLASGTTAQSLATRLTLTSTAMTATVEGIFPATTTGAASLRLPHGTAPSSPVDGDMWTTTAGLYVRINGVTVGPLS